MSLPVRAAGKGGPGEAAPFGDCCMRDPGRRRPGRSGDAAAAAHLGDAEAGEEVPWP